MSFLYHFYAQQRSAIWPDGQCRLFGRPFGRTVSGTCGNKPLKPDENRGFLVHGFRRVRSENASGILVTHEAAGTEALF